MEKGEKIRWLREHFDLSRSELSDQIGISQNTIKSIELGNMACSIKVLDAMAKRFSDYKLWLYDIEEIDLKSQKTPEIEQTRRELKTTGTEPESRGRS